MVDNGDDNNVSALSMALYMGASDVVVMNEAVVQSNRKLV